MKKFLLIVVLLLCAGFVLPSYISAAPVSGKIVIYVNNEGYFSDEAGKNPITSVDVADKAKITVEFQFIGDMNVAEDAHQFQILVLGEDNSQVAAPIKTEAIGSGYSITVTKVTFLAGEKGAKQYWVMCIHPCIGMQQLFNLRLIVA